MGPPVPARIKDGLRCSARLLAAVGLLASAVTWAGTQDADDGYAPAFDGDIQTIAVQAEGHALVGGGFASIDGQSCPNLCRLTVDGRIAPGYDVRGANGRVQAMLRQLDGKVVVAGDFTTMLGQARRGLARLNADGSLDAGFTANVSADGAVRALALQADGKLLVGGSFGTLAGVEQVNLGRLFADGRVDPRFNASVDFSSATIHALQALDDGRLLVGGTFQASGAGSVQNLVRLRADGTLDSGAELSANDTVRVLAREADGRIVAGGDFTQVGPRIRQRLARLEADGSVASTGMPFANNRVNAILVLDDGDLVIAGEFTAVGSALRSRLARLPRGTGVVASFAPDVDLGVFTLALQPDGQVLVGGYFKNVNGSARLSLARISPAGDLDATFRRDPVEPATVLAVATTDDDRVLVGGAFGTLGGSPRPGVARLLPNGEIDAGFSPPSDLANVMRTLAALPGGGALAGGRRGATPVVLRYNGAGAGGSIGTPMFGSNVNAVIAELDGRMLVAGGFSQILGVLRGNIARLTASALVNPTYVAGTSGDIFTAARDGTGVVIGGAFTAVNGVPRTRLARLDEAGVLDPAFAPALNGFVYAVLRQPDGALLIAGAFTTVAGVPRTHLARLRPDGSLDPTFVPNLDDPAHGLFLQADGKLIVTGDFNLVDQQPTGPIARLNPDGRRDPSFFVVAPSGANAEILSAIGQRDGRVLLGGTFDAINGEPRRDIARITTGSAALESLRAQGRSVVWQRGGAAPELSATPVIQSSTDAVVYGTVVPMRRVAGGWQAELPLAVGAQVYLRITAESAGGYYAGSRSRIERVLRHVVTDRLFRHGFD